MSDSVSDAYDSAHPLTFDNLFGSMPDGEFAPSDYERGFAEGQRDMLAKCIAAVEACGDDKGYVYSDPMSEIQWAVAALRALQEKP